MSSLNALKSTKDFLLFIKKYERIEKDETGRKWKIPQYVVVDAGNVTRYYTSITNIKKVFIFVTKCVILYWQQRK